MTAKKQAADRRGSVFEVGITALRLGLTSFGGPVAHLGYFYEEYVKRKKWIDEKTYADLVASLSSSVAGIPPFIRRSTGVTLLLLFAVLLVALPLARAWVHSPLWALFDSFYRAGALVFGGGHVVLPLLEAEVVPQGWVTADQFLAGYSAAQAVPGPLFTFAAYIGMAAFGWKGTLVATAAIFLPSFLLVLGSFPFWHWLRHQPRFQAALAGMNAAVVGILLAALYDPIWTQAVKGPVDLAFVLGAFLLLAIWKWPAWAVVLVSFVGGGLRAWLG